MNELGMPWLDQELARLRAEVARLEADAQHSWEFAQAFQFERDQATAENERLRQRLRDVHAAIAELIECDSDPAPLRVVSDALGEVP